MKNSAQELITKIVLGVATDNDFHNVSTEYNTILMLMLNSLDILRSFSIEFTPGSHSCRITSDSVPDMTIKCVNSSGHYHITTYRDT